MGKLLVAFAVRIMLLALAYFGGLVALVLLFQPAGAWPAPLAGVITLALFIAREELEI